MEEARMAESKRVTQWRAWFVACNGCSTERTATEAATAEDAE
jgi:hypothetical protein